MRLSSIIKMSTLTTGLLAINAATAGSHSTTDYSHCSTSQGSSGECNSPLDENVYNLVNHGIVESTNASSSKISIGGVNVAISGWSDTYGYNDDIVVGADSYKISNYYGYGVTNSDWESTRNSPDHAIDNINTKNGNWQDFDFILFSFDEAVSLTGASYSWVYNQNDSQVSVAALDDIDTLSSGSNTWSDIVSNAVSSSYDIIKYDTSDSHFKYTSEFGLSASAKYWLVGAYNTVFGDIGGNSYDDAFKLTGVGFSVNDSPSTTETTAVSEPSAAGLLLGSGLLVMWRRKRKAWRI